MAARELLTPSLPDIGWIWNWDLGLRFRLGVAAAYIGKGWPPRSYGRLAHDKKGRNMLAAAASGFSGGDAYSKAAS
jgi:hypothetical protein